MMFCRSAKLLMIAFFMTTQALGFTTSNRAIQARKHRMDVAPKKQSCLSYVGEKRCHRNIRLASAGGDLPAPETKKKKILLATAVAAFLSMTAFGYAKRQSLLSTLNYIKNEWLLTTLDSLNAAGPMGLVLYAASFFLWEMTFGITTPVETAAGMAFGPVRGIIVNTIGKLGGALASFLLSRYIFFEKVSAKVKGNELLGLMEESVKETPLRVALLCRFSPLPEFVKNCGMGVMPISLLSYLGSLVIHGGFFTCLWTLMGAESARILREGGPPSSSLKLLVSGATWIGIAAPICIGLWIKNLKEKHNAKLKE